MTSLAIQAVEKTQTTTENNAITTTSTPTSDTKGSSSSKSSSTKKKADMSRLYALYNDAKTRKEKRRESKKKYDDQTGCTFQPTLHKSSSRFNMKKSSMKNKNDKNSPSTTNKSNRFHRLYEQATESQRKKKERIAATPYNCTFKPKLSKKSASYRPKFKGTVGDRLHFQATETQQKKKEMEKVEGLRGCTFQPKLNKKAKASSRTSLYDLNQIKQKKILLEQRRMESEIRGCTFSPSLAPKTERITEKVSNRTTTTPENNTVQKGFNKDDDTCSMPAARAACSPSLCHCPVACVGAPVDGHDSVSGRSHCTITQGYVLRRESRPAWLRWLRRHQ